MRTAALIALGAIIAWLAADALRGDPEPDSRVPELQAAVDSARRIARDARAARDSVERALADSTEAWRQSRVNLQAIASTAREEADSIARHLSAALDTTGARLLADLRAAHRREVLAERERARTWEAEARAKDRVISALHVEVSALTAQVADLEALTDYQRGALASRGAAYDSLHRRNGVNRILATAGMGKMCYDAIDEGQTWIAVGSCAGGLYSALKG